MSDRTALERFQALPLGVRMFLFLSVFYGLFMGGLIVTLGEITLANAAAAGLATLVAAVLYGLFMTLTAGGAQVLATSRLGQEAADLGVRQKRTFFVLGAREQVHAALREGFEALGVRSFDLDDPEAGVLTGHTSWSWKCFGENLGAVIKPRGDACQVTITSEPRLPTTMVDYGKNRDNIRTLEARLLDRVALVESPEEAEVAAEIAGEPALAVRGRQVQRAKERA